MPGGNKKVTHTGVTLLLPPGIKGFIKKHTPTLYKHPNYTKWKQYFGSCEEFRSLSCMKRMINVYMTLTAYTQNTKSKNDIKILLWTLANRIWRV